MLAVRLLRAILSKATTLTPVALGMVVAAGTGCSHSQSSTSPPDASIVLVRHAEKQATGSDPALTPAGQLRALALAERLGEVALQHIYSTDYLRTRQTAGPTARSQQLVVQLYDPANLAAFAAKLRSAGGNTLVVGHSNTTTQLVALLGGEPGPAMNEKFEYDRLYQLTVTADGQVVTQRQRYGTRSEINPGD